MSWQWYLTDNMYFDGSESDEFLSQAKDAFSEMLEYGVESNDVIIDSISTRAIIQDLYNQGQITDDKKILTSIDEIINWGSLVTFNNSNWIVINKPDNANKVYNSCRMRQCNQEITLKIGETETIVDYDDMGRPVYEIIPEYNSWDCIVDTKIYSINLDSAINLPQGQISVTIPYTDKNIKEDMEFSMWDNNYKIIDVDKTKTINTEGLFVITAKKVVK